MDGHLIQCCLQQEISHFLAKDVVNEEQLGQNLKQAKWPKLSKVTKCLQL